MITHRTKLIQGDDVFETVPGLENIIWYANKSGPKPDDPHNSVIYAIVAQNQKSEHTNIPVINIDHISPTQGAEIKEIHVDNKFKTIKVVF